MTGKINRTAGTNRRTFGGLIYLSDFNTECRHSNIQSGSDIAARIARDHRFDQQCQREGQDHA